MYGDLPDSLNLVVNTGHPLVKQVLDGKDNTLGEELKAFKESLDSKNADREALEKKKKKKKEEEVPAAEKEQLEDLNKEIATIQQDKRAKLEDYGKNSQLAKQLVDLALLANGMLKGKALDQFVRRSVDLIK